MRRIFLLSLTIFYMISLFSCDLTTNYNDGEDGKLEDENAGVSLNDIYSSKIYLPEWKVSVNGSEKAYIAVKINNMTETEVTTTVKFSSEEFDFSSKDGEIIINDANNEGISWIYTEIVLKNNQPNSGWICVELQSKWEGGKEGKDIERVHNSKANVFYIFDGEYIAFSAISEDNAKEKLAGEAVSLYEK